MNRKHTVEEYLELIQKLKKVNPKIKFSSDFIIGYPGETENDFQETINLMKDVKFINSYSFIFSARPGTPASNMKMIDYKLAKERLNLFQKLAGEIKLRYRKNLFNKKSIVLFENATINKNEFFGKDEFSNPVIVRSKEKLTGQIKQVKITNGGHNTLFGEISGNFNNKKEFAA